MTEQQWTELAEFAYRENLRFWCESQQISSQDKFVTEHAFSRQSEICRKDWLRLVKAIVARSGEYAW